MGLAAGTRLGPYEISGWIGAGGMGEVYRARDTRLDRSIAIKVLSSALTATPELKARFEREARAISALQHPHICVLHDIGNDGGIDYLVMEYLEGESLADRVKRGPLPVDQALKVAIEIADALDKAHRAGIIHRDLKPANVMLTKSGAKLLDFGLAKPVAVATSAATEKSPGSVLANALTLSTPLSVSSAGTMIGTVQYMSPEQIGGLPADARSDIFAFGVLLYEMVTGKRAFDGKTQASVVGQILAVDPPAIESLQPLTPRSLGTLVRSCLAKDPDERYQTVHDVKLRLVEIADTAPAQESGAVAARSTWWRVFAFGLPLLVLLAAGIWAGMRVGEANAPRPLIQSSILPPPGANFNFVGPNAPPALSRDGRQVAFTATQNGVRRIWVRSLDATQARALPGTEDAVFPFWSPDGKSIGFLSAGKLKRIDIAGGPPFAICDVEQIRGATWTTDGTILFARYPGVIYKVPAHGGTPEAVTKLDVKRGETTQRWPIALPDGKHFLYMASTFGAASDTNAIFVGSVDGGDPKRLFSASTNLAYSDGYLLYTRDNTLIAQPFDLRRLEFTGEPVSMVEHLEYDNVYSKGVFSISANGHLVYRAGSGTGFHVLLLDGDGKIVHPISTLGVIGSPRIAPDGRFVAANDIDPNTGNSAIWIWDLQSGTRTRFTFDNSRNTLPIWSRDGKQIAFASNRDGMFAVYVRDSNGMVPERKIVVQDAFAAKQYTTPSCFTRDGKTLVVNYRPTNTGRSEIQVLSLNDGKLSPIVRSDNGSASGGELSPDNRWIAYVAGEGGVANVYVSPFPNASAKFQISTQGGGGPRWSADGKHLYFVSDEHHVMMADVDGSAGNFRVGQVRELFSSPGQIVGGSSFDVMPDSKHFVVAAEDSETASEPITLVTDWTALLKK